MGRIITPKYALEMGGFHRLHEFSECWKGRVPSVAKLERHALAFAVSTMSGYCNEQIGKAYGIAMPGYARVVVNDGTRKVLVEWRASAFQVLPDPADYPEVAKALQYANSSR